MLKHVLTIVAMAASLAGTAAAHAQVTDRERPALTSLGFTPADFEDAKVLLAAPHAPSYRAWVGCIRRSTSLFLASDATRDARRLPVVYCLEREQAMRQSLIAEIGVVRAGRVTALVKAAARLGLEQAAARNSDAGAEPPPAVSRSHPPLPDDERRGSWAFRRSKGQCVAGLTYDGERLPSVLVAASERETSFTFMPRMQLNEAAATSRRHVTFFAGSREADRVIDFAVLRRNGINALSLTLPSKEADLLGNVSIMWIAGSPGTPAADGGEFFFLPHFFFAIQGTNNC